MKLDSKLDELQMHSRHNDVDETENQTSPMVEDSRTCAQNIGYQLDDEKYYDIPDETIESPSESDSEIHDDDDDNDGDDDILEFINTFDVHRERILYKSCKLTIYEACIEIVKLARELNLNKKQIQSLLNGLRNLLPTENKLPRTVPCLLKIVNIDCSKKVTYYCRECFHPLLSVQQSVCTYGCSLNNQHRSFKNLSELVICDVKQEIAKVANRYSNIIREYQNETNIILPGDVLNAQIYKNLPSSKLNKLTLMLHTDGAPVTKVGGKSLWPIQCTLVEILPPLRDFMDATMVLGAWLGGTHPSRDLLWSKIVEQIHELFKTGITITADDGEKVMFAIRVQLVTFDLPALAQNCNIIQFNGYDACPDCDIHGIAIERQVFYPFSKLPSTPKTDRDYMTFSLQKSLVKSIKGIKGPTPLTRILIFPDQIAKDYMHLVCSGHFKTLITYWERILLPGVFDQGSNYLISIILPHSFKYQFMPLIQYHQWKTKMFRDFLLYVSPIFVSLFLPDSLALHFLHYFVYIRTLYFYDHVTELDGIENLFNYYYERITDYYGKKSQLCTLHLHLHLKDQVLKHGALVFTSCFARESYIGQSVKWCLGRKYILEQFITWYSVDRSLALKNSMKLNDIFYVEKFIGNYINMLLIQNYQDKLNLCSIKKKMNLTGSNFFSRYSRGLKLFHSRAYTRSGYGISYFVSISNENCLMKRKTCFGDVLFYFDCDDRHYAFVKKYKCINFSFSDALPTVSVPQFISDKLNFYYGFYNHKQFSYKIIPVADISNKVINMKWSNDTFVYTDVVCEREHD
ncbi:unnamed protein product [Rotaria magnacalcarata]